MNKNFGSSDKDDNSIRGGSTIYRILWRLIKSLRLTKPYLQIVLLIVQIVSTVLMAVPSSSVPPVQQSQDCVTQDDTRHSGLNQASDIGESCQCNKE